MPLWNVLDQKSDGKSSLRREPLDGGYTVAKKKVAKKAAKKVAKNTAKKQEAQEGCCKC